MAGSNPIPSPQSANASPVYVSFDVDHDRELYERLVAESKAAGFWVSGRSNHLTSTDLWEDQVRRCVREAEQTIVLCGEHSGDSPGMRAELRIVHEEGTPYFLLWGRREAMCTKPSGAKAADGMFSWSRDVLQDQVAIGQRRARSLAASARRRETGS